MHKTKVPGAYNDWELVIFFFNFGWLLKFFLYLRALAELKLPFIALLCKATGHKFFSKSTNQHKQSVLHKLII